MTYEDFSESFNKLLLAFNVNSENVIASKSKIYFERLRRFESETFARAVDEAVDTMSRFPTISELRELLRALTPAVEKMPESCAVCDNGSGWVSIHGTAFRGCCKHGDLLSDKVSRWPLDHSKQRYILERMTHEHFELYGRYPEWSVEENIITREAFEEYAPKRKRKVINPELKEAISKLIPKRSEIADF